MSEARPFGPIPRWSRPRSETRIVSPSPGPEAMHDPPIEDLTVPLRIPPGLG